MNANALINLIELVNQKPQDQVKILEMVLTAENMVATGREQSCKPPLMLAKSDIMRQKKG